jgi:hypothetical protein
MKTKTNLIFGLLFLILFCSLCLAVTEEPIRMSKLNWGMFRFIGFILLPLFAWVIGIILMKKRLENKLWLKWGINLIILFAAQLLSFWICIATKTCVGEWCGIECVAPMLPQLFIGNLMRYFHYFSVFEGPGLIALIVVSVILYFIIGAVIGLIIQKIKSKK